jgi:hypothetical protein
MKLITTSPLEHYNISAFGLRMPPRAAGARQSSYEGLQIVPFVKRIRTDFRSTARWLGWGAAFGTEASFEPQPPSVVERSDEPNVQMA